LKSGWNTACWNGYNQAGRVIPKRDGLSVVKQAKILAMVMPQGADISPSFGKML
jgi:hypothetical protein